MMIIWVILYIVGTWTLVMLALVCLALAAGRPEPCPHGDTRAGCEPCHFNEIEATL
jgi:hypothetical protein